MNGSYPFRVVMPTSDRYVRPASICATLLDRYWPEHPPLDVVCFENRPAVGPGVNVISLGRQRDFDWASAMATYLRDFSRDELVMLTLDDYALCKPVNTRAMRTAVEVMAADFSVASFALAWMPVKPKRRYAGRRDVVEFPDWEYLVNLQAAVWRRKVLLGLMSRAVEGIAVWSLEVAASKCFRQVYRDLRQVGYHMSEPAKPSFFIDETDKTHWAFPYHNLMHKGLADSRHDAFLKGEGFQAQTLITTGT